MNREERTQKIDQIYRKSARSSGCKRVDGLCVKGESLGRFINNRINEMAGDDEEERQAIIARLARESGRARGAGTITVSTVNQILRGEVNCPPLTRLEGFAKVLGVSVTAIRRAAERDGCDYSESE